MRMPVSASVADLFEIGFSEWTEDGKLPHPRFIGLRTDRPAPKVVRKARREGEENS